MQLSVVIWNMVGSGGEPGEVAWIAQARLCVSGTVLTTFRVIVASAMAQRVTLRKRNPYNTTSNRRRVVKTPGGKLVYHHIKKLATAPKCGDCGIALPGVCLALRQDK